MNGTIYSFIENMALNNTGIVRQNMYRTYRPHQVGIVRGKLYRTEKQPLSNVQCTKRVTQRKKPLTRFLTIPLASVPVTLSWLRS